MNLHKRSSNQMNLLENLSLQQKNGKYQNIYIEEKLWNSKLKKEHLNTVKKMEGNNVHIFIKLIIHLFSLSHHKTVRRGFSVSSSFAMKNRWEKVNRVEGKSRNNCLIRNFHFRLLKRIVQRSFTIYRTQKKNPRFLQTNKS